MLARGLPSAITASGPIGANGLGLLFSPLFIGIIPDSILDVGRLLVLVLQQLNYGRLRRMQILWLMGAGGGILLATVAYRVVEYRRMKMC